MFRYFCVNVLASAGACRASTGPVLVGGAACPALEGMAKACGVAEAQGGSDFVDLEQQGRQVVDSYGLAQARQQFQIGRPLLVDPTQQRETCQRRKSELRCLRLECAEPVFRSLWFFPLR